jgi:photosystem II stability/assembly factor-like uncharacterized protein
VSFVRRDGFREGIVHRIAMATLVAATATSWTSPPARAGALAGWVNTGPPGAILEDIAVSPADPSRLYASNYHQVYRSGNGGKTWQGVSGSSSESSLAVSWDHPDVVYAANRNRIKKSTDGGVTWTDITAGLPGPPVHMVVAPGNDATVYAGVDRTPSGVYRTSNGGSTWSRMSNGLPTGVTFDALAINPSSPLVLLVATSGGMFATTDGAGTWSPAGGGLPQSRRLDRLAIDPSDGLRVFATVDRHVYRSLDGGASWVRSDTGLGNAPALGLAVSSADPGTVYTATAPGWPTDPAGPSGVFRSVDGGDTWVQTTDVVGATVMAVDSTGTTVAIGDPAGVLRSLDGGVTWFPASQGMLETSVTAVAVDPTNAAVSYASTGSKEGLFKSNDGGRSWTFTGTGLKQPVVSLAVAPSDPSVIYAGAGNFDWYGYYAQVGVYRSTDGGASWLPVNIGIDDVQVDALAVDPTDPNVVYAAGEYFCDECNDGGVWKSVDGGATWVELSVEHSAFPAIAMSPTSPNVLYAAASTYGTVYRTVDGGATWSRISNGLGSALIADLAVDASNPYLVYAVDARFYRSGDGGAHWTKGGPGTPQQSYTVQADPIVAGSLCAGESSGRVSCSVDGGTTWTRIPGVRRAIAELAIGTGNVLYVGTAGHGAAVFYR